MKHFINEYEYTSDIISEGVRAWWQKKFKNGYIAMLIIMVLILLLSLSEKRLGFLILELIPLLLVILFKLKENRAIQIEQEKMKVIFQNTVPVLHVALGQEVHVITTKNETHVAFSDIEDFIETKNLIVLLLKGSLTVALSKNGFKEGSAEECIAFLKENIK